MAYIDVSTLPGVTLLAGIDPVTRDMFLSAATVDATINPMDIYSEMRICRRLNESLRPYDVFLTAFGNIAKGGGKFTERYVQQNQGTRFVPFDISHELTVNGTVITDDGQEGIACFDRTSLNVATVVDINYIPPQVEVITVNSGSGVTPQDKIDIVNQVFARVVESGETFEEMLRLLRANAAGDIVEDGAGNYTIKSINGLIDRITGQEAANNGRDVTAVDTTP